MSKERTPFESPQLIGLDGREVTEDKLLEELTADRVCLGGGHNCSGGGKPATLADDDGEIV